MPVDIPAILDGTGRTISFLARRAASFPVAVYRRVTGKTQPVLARNKRITVIDSERQYKASNPRWLAELAKSSGPWPCPPELQGPELAAFEEEVAAAGGTLDIEFGRPARDALFTLDPSVTYLNHGSYGAAFQLALQQQAHARSRLEAQPVAFMETDAVQGVCAAVAEVAALVHASPLDVVPVANATSAVNAVLRSTRLRKRDCVLMLNTTYPAVKSTIVREAMAAGARVLQVDLSLDELASPQRVVAAVQEGLAAASGRCVLAVLDHVVSFPPVVLPIKELVAACTKAGARVLVDGAHAVGSWPGGQELDVPSLAAHYYTANLHKWCMTPKGAAFLWVTRSCQAATRPVVTSHGYGLGFRPEFLWQGTSDVTPWLAVPAALSVMRALGPARITQYSHTLVTQAAQMLHTRLHDTAHACSSGAGSADGTGNTISASSTGSTGSSTGRSTGSIAGRSGAAQTGIVKSSAAVGDSNSLPTKGKTTGKGVAQAGQAGKAAARSAAGRNQKAGQEAKPRIDILGVDGQGRNAGMLAVRLPPLQGYDATPAGSIALHQALRQQHNIEIPVIALDGSLWVRLSAQVYNEMADYEELAALLVALL